MLTIPPNLKRLASVSGYADAVHVQDLVTPEGHHYKVSATDGHVAVIVRGVSHDPPKGTPEPEGVRSYSDTLWDYFVGEAEWRSAMSLVRQGGGIGLLTMLADKARNKVCFAARTVGVAEELPSVRKYPDLEAVFPRTPPIVSVELSVPLLQKLLDLAADLQSLDAEDISKVTLCWFGPNMPVGVVARNPNMEQDLEAVIMPIVPKGTVNPIAQAITDVVRGKRPKPVKLEDTPEEAAERQDLVDSADEFMEAEVNGAPPGTCSVRLSVQGNGVVHQFWVKPGKDQERVLKAFADKGWEHWGSMYSDTHNGLITGAELTRALARLPLRHPPPPDVPSPPIVPPQPLAVDTQPGGKVKGTKPRQSKRKKKN